MKRQKIKKVLYVEGTAEQDNGSLRKAFATLLEHELSGDMPAIVMGDGVTQTVDKFMTRPLQPHEQRFLLIDLDQPPTDTVRTEIMKSYNESKPNRKTSLDEQNTFFMVQEAEAWILSQPSVLESVGISTKSLPKCDVTTIRKPSQELARLYKLSGRTYHKVTDFTKVFVLLNSDHLKQYFSDYNRLVTALRSAL